MRTDEQYADEARRILDYVGRSPEVGEWLVALMLKIIDKSKELREQEH